MNRRDVLHTGARGEGQAIVVAPDSPVTSVADLQADVSPS